MASPLANQQHGTTHPIKQYKHSRFQLYQSLHQLTSLPESSATCIVSSHPSIKIGGDIIKIIPDWSHSILSHPRSHLALTSTRIDEKEGGELGRILSTHSSLSILSISSSHISQTALHSLNPIFAAHANLTCIHLSSCWIKDEQGEVLLASLASNNNLCVLDLSDNVLKDTSGYIGRFLNANRSLLSINLSENKLGDRCLEDILDVTEPRPFFHFDITRNGGIGHKKWQELPGKVLARKGRLEVVVDESHVHLFAENIQLNVQCQGGDLVAVYLEDFMVSVTQIRRKELKLYCFGPGGKSRHLLGVGSKGKVLKGKYTGKSVTVKKVSLQVPNLDSYKKEIAIYQAVNHPNMVQLIGANLAVPKPFAVFEYVDQGNLSGLLYERGIKLSKKQKVRILMDVAKGLSYLHDTLFLIHRNIKTPNILITSDMGAKIDESTTSKLFIEKALKKESPSENQKYGTFHWMAPDILKGGFKNRSYSTYTSSVDIYSFAVVIWELFSERLPFEKYDVNSTKWVEEVVNGNLRPSPLPLGISDDLKEIMNKCWQAKSFESTNWDEDPSAQDILRVLEDEPT